MSLPERAVSVSCGGSHTIALTQESAVRWTLNQSIRLKNAPNTQVELLEKELGIMQETVSPELFKTTKTLLDRRVTNVVETKCI